MLLSRPGKLRAHRTSGHNDATMTFDGKTVSIVSRSLEGYAQFETPGTLDRLIEVPRTGCGVALPAADLIKTNSCELLVAGVLEVRHIGRGVVGGVLREHLALRNVDTDGQLWVEAGEKPIPRKMVITSKTMNSAPQYTVVVKSWKTGVTPAPGAFAFVPAPNAKKLDPNELVDLDELPQGRPQERRDEARSARNPARLSSPGCPARGSGDPRRRGGGPARDARELCRRRSPLHRGRRRSGCRRHPRGGRRRSRPWRRSRERGRAREPRRSSLSLAGTGSFTA